MATMPTDPMSPTYACEMAAYLREGYYSILAGGAEKVIRYKGPNGEREVQFAQPNIAMLQAELQKWEALCANAGSTDPKPARFAIRGGAALRRAPYPGNGWE
jgi:hypothetical protein